MIKKIFTGVLLAGVFGLLVLGAVNRTLAKTNQEPLALSETREDRNNTGSVTSFGGGNGRDEASIGSGYGTGKYSSTSGLGRNSRTESYAGGGTGVGLANVQSWEDPITATLTSMTADVWTVSNDEGFVHEIEGRTLRFMLENGFTAEVGDELVLIGFYEADKFEIGEITNTTILQELMIRDEYGRPLWSGRYQ
jgi:hypothetical protein